MQHLCRIVVVHNELKHRRTTPIRQQGAGEDVPVARSAIGCLAVLDPIVHSARAPNKSGLESARAHILDERGPLRHRLDESLSRTYKCRRHISLVFFQLFVARYIQQYVIFARRTVNVRQRRNGNSHTHRDGWQIHKEVWRQRAAHFSPKKPHPVT